MRELVSLFNRRQPIEVARFFAPSFQLDQPGGVNRAGLEGAQAMVDGLYALGEHAQLEIVALLEEGDHVAVRWRVLGARDAPEVAMIAMYRFVEGRIADDWGLVVPAPWQRSHSAR
jgi:predicted SnoaL-like aldol condensation-catalyzing enzyme